MNDTASSASVKTPKVSLIIGAGEVGHGLFTVLEAAYPGQVFIRDLPEPSEEPEKVDYLHICFPFVTEKSFKAQVNDYRKRYDPELLVIHSTVPVGTTRKFGTRAVHSPIRGKHPELAKGIQTFVKYIGSVVPDLTTGNVPALQLAEYFIGAKIKTHVFNRSETTELGKIMETTQYGWFIVLAKEIKKVCDAYGVDFTEVYSIHNHDYNEGYQELGMSDVCRPVLKDVPGPIGGHCVVQNCELVNNPVTKLVKKFNADYVQNA